MGELEPTLTYSNPTATERFRAMLDERGVEWKAPASYDGSTKYDTIVDGYWFHEYDGKITVHGLTPEQAIAATLGSCNCSDNCTNGERTGTCHMEQTGHVKVAGVDYYDDDYECSECGAEIFEGYNFCPMCGRRIEQ